MTSAEQDLWRYWATINDNCRERRIERAFATAVAIRRAFDVLREHGLIPEAMTIDDLLARAQRR